MSSSIETKGFAANTNKIRPYDFELVTGSDYKIIFDIKPSVYSKKEQKYLPYPKMRIDSVVYTPLVKFTSESNDKYILMTEKTIPYKTKEGKQGQFNVDAPYLPEKSGNFEFNNKTVQFDSKVEWVNTIDRNFYTSQDVVKNGKLNYSMLSNAGNWDIILTPKQVKILETAIYLRDKFEQNTAALKPWIAYAEVVLKHHKEGTLKELFKYTKNEIIEGEFDAKGMPLSKEILTNNLDTSFEKFSPLNRLYETLSYLSRKESYPNAFGLYAPIAQELKQAKEDDNSITEEDFFTDKEAHNQFKLLETYFKGINGWTYDSDTKSFVDELFIRIVIEDKLPSSFKADMEGQYGLKKVLEPFLTQKDKSLKTYYKPDNVIITIGAGLKRKIDKETGESKEGENADKLVFFAKFYAYNKSNTKITNPLKTDQLKEVYEYVSIWDLVNNLFLLKNKLLQRTYLIENNKSSIDFELVKILKAS